MWDEEIPWSAEEQEAYRQGKDGKTYRRTWSGPSRYELRQFYRPYIGTAMSLCPDCGRPALTEDMQRFQMGRCWNCYMENKEPGFHARAFEQISPARVAKTPQPSLVRLKG